jgi:IS4 transposase
MLSPVFDPFVEKSPVSVMARGMVERVLNPDQINKWFDTTAKEQYTKDLMFSSVVDIMSQVVCGSRSSVSAAYQAAKEEVGVSIASVYNKLNGIEPQTSAELVRFASRQVVPIIEALGGTNPAPLPGYRMKLLDGNCIEKSEHRLKELRDLAAGPLPGKSLVVYDPVLRLPIDVFPCEDGHAQERSLLTAVLTTVEANDVWMADRNFCTVEFTCKIDSKDAYFIIREHKNYPWQPCGKEKYIGKIDTGKVYERLIKVIDGSGKEHLLRRIRLSLKTPTRDEDKEIAIITNLPKKAANAKKIAELYRTRWTIETAFQHLAEHLNSEINTLGYPRAALFGFCVALIAYIVMSVIKAALASVHGIDVVENEVSGYYVAEEISGTYQGMMIAIPEELLDRVPANVAPRACGRAHHAFREYETVKISKAPQRAEETAAQAQEL